MCAAGKFSSADFADFRRIISFIREIHVNPWQGSCVLLNDDAVS
jgi:hypothetical protein